MKRTFLLLILLLITKLNAQSQQWKSYFDVNQQVLAVEFQDPFLWIATTHGLYRENVVTKEQTIFNTSNSSIPSNQVTHLALQGSKMWVGFDNGIGFYENESWTFFPRTSYTPQQEGISSISPESNSILWVTGWHSIARYDGTNWKIFDESDGIPYLDPANPVLHTGKVVQHAGATWIITGELGVLKYQNGVFSIYKVPGHQNDFIYESNIAVVNEGLIIGTNTGTYLIDTSTDQIIREFNGRVSTNLFSNNGDYFWSYNISDGSLLKIKSTGETTSCDLTFNDIVEFTNGDYAAASTKGLVEKKDNVEAIRKLIPSIDIPSFQFRNMTTDSNGGLWLGAFSGDVIKKIGETWTVYPNISAECIASDKAGNVWVGGDTEGLTRIDPAGGITNFNTSNSTIPGNFISHIAFDKDGNLWASFGNGDNDAINQGNYRGICKMIFDNGSIANVLSIPSGNNGPSKAYPSDMLIDNNNVLWICYYGHLANPWEQEVPALSKYDGTSWTHYNFQNTNLKSMQIGALAVDDNNDLYLLNNTIYDNSTFTYKCELVKFNAANSISYPLPLEWMNSISGYDLQFDNVNTMWVSSTKGVASISRSNQTWTVYNAQNSSFPKIYSNSYDHTVSQIAITDNTKYFNCTNGYIGADGLVEYNEKSSIDKTIQAISFTVADQVYAEGLIVPLSATASSALPITYLVVSGNAHLNGNLLIVDAPGAIIIQARQDGDDNYNPAQAAEVGFCVKPMVPKVELIGSSLTSDIKTGQIQWYNDDAVIDNAQMPVLQLSESGNYTVKVTVNGCASTSAAKTVAITDVHENIAESVQVYPIPVQDKLYIQFEEAYKIIIRNVLGQKLIDQHSDDTAITIIDLSQINNQVLYLELIGKKTFRQKIIKGF